MIAIRHPKGLLREETDTAPVIEPAQGQATSTTASYQPYTTYRSVSCR